MNELIEFCNKYDYTFNIKYEKCFYTFVIKIKKIIRLGKEALEGIETDTVTFIRADNLEDGIKKAIIEAMK